MQKIDKELISENSITSIVGRRVFELSNLLSLKEKSVKNSTKTSLRISKSNGVVQYYFRANPQNKKSRYISVKNKKLAQELAQQDYDNKIVQAARQELKILQRLLRQYEGLSSRNHLVEKIFPKLNLLRQALIKPVRFSDNFFAEQWQNVSYEKKTFPEDSTPFSTSRDELVRSKSELIIAETLKRMNIPYRYEFPLQLTSETGRLITIHPDFMCLNVKNRKEYFWEHFGMMDNPEYAEQAVQKLNLYALNGFLPGENLIITTETRQQPISTKVIEKIIRDFLA